MYRRMLHRKVWKHQREKLNKKPFRNFVLLFSVCVCVSESVLFSVHRVLFSHYIYEHEILMCLTIYLTRKPYNNSHRLRSLLYPISQHLLLPLLLLALGVFIFYFISFFVPSKQIVFLFVWIFSICVWLFFNCICKKLKSTKKHVGAFCGNILSEIVLNFYFIFCYSESGWLHSIVEKNRIVTCNRKYGKSRSDCYLQRTFQCSPNFIYGTVPIATVK